MNSSFGDSSLERAEPTMDKKEVIIIDIEADKIINQFRDNIEDIKSKFKLVEKLSESEEIEQSKDILRSQVVFLLSALDFYMHEIVKWGIVKIFQKERPNTSSYKNFIVSLEVVEKAINNPENIDWLQEEIIHRNSFKSFLKLEEIKKNISMISNNKVVDNAIKKIGKPSDIKGELTHLYVRRNQIAHQSDRDNATTTKNDINLETTRTQVELVSQFIENIHEELMNED
ncbi:MAG: hypothetical protein ATN35_01910 [Epulopiscium sp. Nele67-Bin004]|nr:MAG: hypothetical protein ATN35_01910 [Epulopiscium sp. Nele67-Bin004]